MKFTLVLLVAMVACCMAAVPLDEPRAQAKAAEKEQVAEPELVLAEPLNPALLAAPGAGVRLVRQTYDDVNVDVVNSKFLFFFFFYE